MQPDPNTADLALNHARQALETGDVSEAKAICARLLQQDPACASAMHMLSLLEYREGHHTVAIATMSRAIELSPKRADWLNDLGNLLAADKQYDQAAQFFKHALQQTPTAVTWNNLGAMCVKLGQVELAGEAFEQAIALDDTLLDAWANYANWLTSQGRDQDATECVLRAFVAAPSGGQSLVLRGMALNRLGRQQEAARCFREHLNAFPEDPTALHLFHACAGDAVPERATDAYILALYDDVASSYDALQREMSYRGVDLVASVVENQCGTGLDVLDAGCGTGLVGKAIARHCQHLTGVDLSGKMLEHAAATGVYHTLETGEISAYLAAHAAEFDLITASDLLSYFGPLTTFSQRAFAALRPGGRLIATLEANPESPDNFNLRSNGRYSHAEPYLIRCLSDAGFDCAGVTLEPLRNEHGQDVPCWLVLAHKPAA